MDEERIGLWYNGIVENVLLSIGFGVAGGLVRALVGIVKYFEKNRAEQKLRLGYFAFSLLVAAIVGGIIGVIAGGDWRLLEGLYKIRMRQGFEI